MTADPARSVYQWAYICALCGLDPNTAIAPEILLYLDRRTYAKAVTDMQIALSTLAQEHKRNG